MSKKLFSSLAICAAAVLMLAAGAALAAVTAGNTGWKWSNPLPQGNTLTNVETAGGRVYAAGATGTLLRSDDGGANWSAIRTGLLDDVQLVRAITPDSIVFAGRCALRRSDDGGTTVRRLAWGPSDDTCVAEIASFSFPSSSVGFLLLTNGEVYTTSDAGVSWNKKTAAPGSKVAGGASAVRDIWFTSPANGVVSAGNQIFQTTDGGSSWTPVATASGTGLLNFEFISGTEGFAAGDGSDLLTTIDGGATWTPVAGDGQINQEQIRQLTCADATTCLAVNAAGNKILRTNTGGATWAAVTAATTPIYAAGLTSASHAVAVGTGGATVATDDGGATWAQINSGAAGKFYGIRATSSTNALVYGGNGSLARTTDGGNSWKPLTVSTSAALLDAAFTSANRGFVLDSNGGLLRTDNGGTSWKFLDTGTSAQPDSLFAPNDSTVVLIGPRGLRRSTNGGDDFAAVGGRKIKRLALYEYDTAGSTLFAYGTKAIVVSKNNGGKWAAVKLPRKVKIEQLDMVSAKAGYLLDTKAELYFTKNAGKKWTRIETTGANFVSSMAFGDVKTGYLTDDSGRVLATVDGGKTWSRQYPFFDSKSNSPMLIAAPTTKSAFILVANSNHIFSTTSSGAIGTASILALKSSSKKVRKGTTVKVTGKLAPAQGGERVTVLARVKGAKGGTRWASQERTVSATGTFTTTWRIKKPTIFIARWSGDAGHDGDAAPAVTVVIRKK